MYIKRETIQVFTIIQTMKKTGFFALIFAQAVFAGRLQDSIPDNACSDACQDWQNLTLGCFDQGQTLSVQYDIANMAFSSSGFDNAFFCLCNDQAIQASPQCLGCLQDQLCVSDPFTVDDYQQACQGNFDGSLAKLQVLKDQISFCGVQSADTIKVTYPDSNDFNVDHNNDNNDGNSGAGYLKSDNFFALTAILLTVLYW